MVLWAWLGCIVQSPPFLIEMATLMTAVEGGWGGWDSWQSQPAFLVVSVGREKEREVEDTTKGVRMCTSEDNRVFRLGVLSGEVWPVPITLLESSTQYAPARCTPPPTPTKRFIRWSAASSNVVARGFRLNMPPKYWKYRKPMEEQVSLGLSVGRWSFWSLPAC